MKPTSILVALLQRAAAAPQPRAAQPQVLDDQDLSKVAGGLPRGGGWASTGAPEALTEHSAGQLPRGGGW